MILLGLGANMPSAAGSPDETVAAALGVMATRSIRTAKVSRFYETPAWPNPADPPFINAVARVQTPLGPASLLQALHEIETEFGRVRDIPNAPRTLDLDILDYEGRIDEGPPVLPHPRIAERAFVLIPLRDVAPEWRHPVNGQSVTRLLEAIPAAEREAVRPLTR